MSPSDKHLLSVVDPLGRRDLDDKFIHREVERGAWRPFVVAPEVSGIARPVTIYLATRKSEMVKWGWHGDERTFCPPTWADIGIGSGACGFGCRSCFLMLTFRTMRDPLGPVVYDNGDDFDRAVRKWLAAKTWDVEGKGVRLRTTKDAIGLGIDCSDSLLWEGVTGHARRHIPIFTDAKSNPLGNLLVLLTKSANTRFLAELSDAALHRVDGCVPNIAITMSLNPESIADLWEGKFPDTLQRITPPISKRLEALRAAQDMGFDVRARIDPILTPDGWQERYAQFFTDMAHRYGLRPSMLTLGSHREKFPQLDTFREKWGLPPLEWEAEKTPEREGTHFHMAGREQVYAEVRDIVARAFSGTGHTPWVSLCKETHDVRKATGLLSANCNCLPQTGVSKRHLVILSEREAQPAPPPAIVETGAIGVVELTDEASDEGVGEPDAGADVEEDEVGPHDEDGAGLAPGDGRGIEDELESLISRLTDDLSELAMVKLLPRAKALYEQLHPETRHGGVREQQVTKDGTCPSFVEFVRQRAGIAPSSIYNKLQKATELEALDGDAEHLSYGTPLANKIGLLVRIARIPQKALHRDLVNIYRNAGPKKAKQELAKWEEEFGTKPKPKDDPERKSNEDSKSGDVDREKLLALLMAHADAVRKIQEFLFGMPVASLMKTLTQLTGEQLTEGKVGPEGLNVLITRRSLYTRVASIMATFKTEGDVAPTAARKFQLDVGALDKAIMNPKLTAAEVAKLEETWARAVAYVNATSPIEQMLAPSATEAAS